MKIRGILILVIAYILAAFGWWLFSLVKFANKEHLIEIEKRNLNNTIIKNEIVEYLNSHHLEGSLYQNVKIHINEVNRIISKANIKNKSVSVLNLNKAATNLNSLIEIQSSPLEILGIDKTHQSHLRAFYSEAVVFTIAVILGVLWVFSRLESLLNLNKMQNNFLLSVTHELKTPLAAIKLGAQTLFSRKLNEEQHGSVLNQTISNANRLNELIDNVLLTTRIDGSSYKYDIQEINITELISKEANTIFCPPVFEGKLLLPTEPKMIFGDILSLRLVFSNIFQNTLKYASVKAQVVISITENNNLLQIKIADNGPGIAQKEKNKIFKKFYRIGDENTRQSQGTGLGLFLVKQILRKHKSNITVEKNSPNGAIFNITFNIINKK